MKGKTLTLACVCSNPTGPANDVSVRTNRIERYKYHSEKDGIFLFAKIPSKKGGVKNEDN